MTYTIILLIIVIAAALAFEYINGFHDAANAIATVVSTKVLSPRTALIYGAVFNFFGAFFGSHVAKTIGAGIVEKTAVSQEVILCALIGAILWNLLTWYFGIPSSSSHALIGGLLGAAIAHNGFGVVHVIGLLEKVVFPMFTSPLVGFFGGFFLMLALLWMFAKAVPEKINKTFKRLQLCSAGIMAFSHGSNDAQKTMGIITLSLITFSFLCLQQRIDDRTLVSYNPLTKQATVLLLDKNDNVTDEHVHSVLRAGTQEKNRVGQVMDYDKVTSLARIQMWDQDGSSTNEILGDVLIVTGSKFIVPNWVIFVCALTMGLGTMAGGWKIIHTIGTRVIKLKPIHGFAAETTAACTILTSSFFGFPVSTTHIISTAIMGVGSTIRLSAVKWGLVGNIVLAWFLTIPVCAIISAVLYKLFVWY